MWKRTEASFHYRMSRLNFRCHKGRKAQNQYVMFSNCFEICQSDMEILAARFADSICCPSGRQLSCHVQTSLLWSVYDKLNSRKHSFHWITVNLLLVEWSPVLGGVSLHSVNSPNEFSQMQTTYVILLRIYCLKSYDGDAETSYKSNAPFIADWSAWASYKICKIAGCACTGNAVFLTTVCKGNR